MIITLIVLTDKQFTNLILSSVNEGAESLINVSSGRKPPPTTEDVNKLVCRTWASVQYMCLVTGVHNPSTSPPPRGLFPRSRAVQLPPPRDQQQV